VLPPGGLFPDALGVDAPTPGGRPVAAGLGSVGCIGRAAGPIVRVPTLEGMTILRMDNVGIVFDDLDAAVAFFVELGLELEG
jgi:hypothetical protein